MLCPPLLDGVDGLFLFPKGLLLPGWRMGERTALFPAGIFGTLCLVMWCASEKERRMNEDHRGR